MLALLSLATGFAGAMHGPDRLAERYRLEVVIKQEVDATAAGQGIVASELNGIAFVTVAMSDTTGGQLAHVVVDSLVLTAVGQFEIEYTQTLADSLKGQWLHGYIVDGKLVGAAQPSVTDNVTINLVMPVMNALFPGIGAKAASAESWPDTTRNENVTGEMTRRSQAIVQWTVTSREGDVLSVTGAGTGTLSVEAPEQQATGQVTSTASVTTVIGGPATAAKLANSQELSVLIPQLPDPLPVKIATEATLTRLP
jgi:hypothetical protein